jgi:RNA polymerase sigma-70 factor (ECF subfamily)
MGGGGTSGRAVVYCVVPGELAGRLFEPLREHFRGDRSIEVVVERRDGERRHRRERREAPPQARGRGQADRRAVRSTTGRRITERRALATATAEHPALPRGLRRYEKRLVFVERLEPTSEQRLDADSKRLVIRYQSGDESVFGELYLRYFNAVYSYARVALDDYHEAEDLTQQVFIRVLSALGDYEARPGVPFRAWLFAIARNAVIDAIRGQRAMLLDSAEQIDLLREEAASLSEAPQDLGWLTDHEILMFVERLPLLQRQVLVLRFVLDMPGEEVARALGRSHISVRKLQSRALKTLEQRLAAVGRASSRSQRAPSEVRLRGLGIVVRRRFALGIRPPRAAA